MLKKQKRLVELTSEIANEAIHSETFETDRTPLDRGAGFCPCVRSGGESSYGNASPLSETDRDGDRCGCFGRAMVTGHDEVLPVSQIFAGGGTAGDT